MVHVLEFVLQQSLSGVTFSPPFLSAMSSKTRLRPSDLVNVTSTWPQAEVT